jgi:hypothetical protein
VERWSGHGTQRVIRRARMRRTSDEPVRRIRAFVSAYNAGGRQFA